MIKKNYGGKLKMAIKILHGHANAGPGGKRSYIAFGGNIKQELMLKSMQDKIY